MKKLCLLALVEIPLLIVKSEEPVPTGLTHWTAASPKTLNQMLSGEAAANPHYFAVKQPTDFLDDIVRENPRCIARPSDTLSPSERNMHLFGLRARPVAHFAVHASTLEKLKSDRRLRSCRFALYTLLCPVPGGNKGSRHRVPIGVAGLDCGGPHPMRPDKAR